MEPRFLVQDYREADINAVYVHVRETVALVKKKFLAEAEGRTRELWWDVLHRLDAIVISCEDGSRPENLKPENRLSQAFLWDYSPEGWDYWHKVTRALDGRAPISDAYEE
jgi:hypothetical protein